MKEGKKTKINFLIADTTFSRDREVLYKVNINFTRNAVMFHTLKEVGIPC